MEEARVRRVMGTACFPVRVIGLAQVCLLELELLLSILKS